MHFLLFLLVAAVVFVNGWTDAPNAITCVVSTGTMPYSRAVFMAAVCNLLGIFVMCLVNASVADTVSGLVRLNPGKPEESVAVLCAAMIAIVLFAVGAWCFGIPTSESHALIAALTGAALAQGNIGAVNLNAWGKVLLGLVFSLALGFGFGWGITRTLGRILRRGGDRLLDSVQILSGAGMAFMHGAQDGQKFLAVFLLAGAITRGTAVSGSSISENIGLLILVAVVMAMGTLVGGRRIITCVGGKMVKLQKYQGSCADLGGALCLLLASLFGIPMSTTHTKTTAIMGAGCAAKGARIDRGIVRSMFAAWFITFPVCGAIGYVVAGILLRLSK